MNHETAFQSSPNLIVTQPNGAEVTPPRAEDDVQNPSALPLRRRKPSPDSPRRSSPTFRTSVLQPNSSSPPRTTVKPRKSSRFHISCDQVNFNDFQTVEEIEEAPVKKIKPPANDNKSFVDIPERVVTHVPMIERELLSGLQVLEAKITHEKINETEWKKVREHLYKEGRLDIESALNLIDYAIDHFEKQPNILDLTGSVVICGDVHGQFFDLCNLIEEIGDPKDVKYLFLGDYVDRGEFSTEVCFLLFSIMLTYPNNFFLLRGNHETRLLTTNFNFKKECYYKYNEEVYDAFMDCFDFLPLAATIKSHDGKKTYFCCHGGLSPDLHSIEDINNIDRRCEPPPDGLFCDLLWADPVNEEETTKMSEEELERWKDVTFRNNRNRGCSYEFGYRAVERFLKENNIDAIIRAHEVKRLGYEEHFFKHPDLSVAPVITVFSAPNYCDMYENRAAYLSINGTNGSIRFGSITWTSHPYWLPDYEDAFTFSLPFLGECLATMYMRILEFLDVNESQVAELKAAYATIAKQRVLKQNRLQLAKTLIKSGKDVFQRAKKVDFSNEMRPLLPKKSRLSARRIKSAEW